MNKKKLARIIAATVLAITAGGGYALGASTPFTLNSNGPFYACVTGVNGNITKVTNTPKTCPKGTVSINWNSVGPKGDKGDPGDDGSANSTLTTYLESPDGTQRYPYFADPDAGPQVYVDGTLFTYSFTELTGSNSFNGAYAFKRVYKSSNCSGSALYLRLGVETTPPTQLNASSYAQAVNTYLEYRPDASTSFTGRFQLTSNADVSTLSYWTLEGCASISNVNQDLLAVKNLAKLASDYSLANGVRLWSLHALTCDLYFTDEQNLFLVNLPNCVPPQSSLWKEADLDWRDSDFIQQLALSYYELVPVQVPDVTGWKIVIK